MATYQVPKGQDGVTITLAASSPAVVSWPFANPAEVRIAVSGGAARFGFRGSAASKAPGVAIVADGQSVLVSTRVEATPLALNVEAASPKSTVLVTVTGYREPDVLISDPVAANADRMTPVIAKPGAGGSSSVVGQAGPAGRGVVSITMLPNGWLAFLMSDGSTELAQMPVPDDPMVDDMNDMPSLSLEFENGLM